MSAIDLSGTIALVAVGALSANLLLGLLMASGYNPSRQWPHRRIKLFTFHNWTGWTPFVPLAHSKMCGYQPPAVPVARPGTRDLSPCATNSKSMRLGGAPPISQFSPRPVHADQRSSLRSARVRDP